MPCTQNDLPSWEELMKSGEQLQRKIGNTERLMGRFRNIELASAG